MLQDLTERAFCRVHIDGGVTDEKVDEIQQVMADYSSQNGDEENYMGYIDIYKGEDQIMIYLDLGGVSEEKIATWR